MPATRTLIADLEPSQIIEGIYAIHNCQLGQTKTGKPYIKCLLADKSGRAPGRMWNATEELFAQLPTDVSVKIDGQTQPYQGEMQIIVQRIEAVQPTGEQLRELLPATEYDVDEMYGEVMGLLEQITDPSLYSLSQAYLDDEQLMGWFKEAPAAMTLHHAYLGGLLEHTRQLLRLAEVICPAYPELNADIVRVGLFLHDLGKCGELTWQKGFGYSDDGQLVGHTARGVIWLEEKARQCAEAGKPIPREVLMVLHHILLSHHGQAEFGAVKIPSTPEAWAVSLIDNLDAKMHMAISATRNAAKGEQLGGHFTEKIWALGTRMYRPDPTTLNDETG